jgi:tetratricopeptide (TPR) repeat protein
MGVVYLAEQTHPIHRKVAVKIVKPGMDSAQVIARFEAERQALALMDHPNIAKVFDAGTTSPPREGRVGRPYFVMELVPGIPITDYCDRARLTPRERLELLVPVCQAIQHAHQKGIIHRDVKPSNVLVARYDGTPIPKVIDFGVAKAIDQRLTERTLFTRVGALVGTPEYMSPEQADFSGGGIDTRSDIYSLGVLLYELLSGTTPLERPRLRQAGFGEILHRICEEDPPKLSTRLSHNEKLASIAAQRSMEPARLIRLLRGELDWIVMKALEKDRNRRYASANDLARDLQRYLADEPVEAGPVSARYRLRKYAQKHRGALATATAFAAVLVLATVISTGQAVRATREQARARRSEVEAKTVLGFFRDKVLAATRPEGLEGGLGRDVSVRAAIDAAEPSIASDFAGEPNVEAAIRDTLGTTYLYLGDPEPAIRQHERARALRAANLGPDHPETLGSANDLAVAYRIAGRITEAIRIFQDVLAHRTKQLGPDHPDTLTTMNNLAVAYQAAGRTTEAIPLHEQELAHCRATLGSDHPATWTSMNNLAAAYQVVGRLDDALPLLEEVLQLRRTKLGSDHPDTLTSMNNLAATYQVAGRAAKAIPMFDQVLAIRKTKLGPNHVDTLKSLNNLALAHQESGRNADAIPMLEEVLQVRKGKLGPDHADTLTSMNNLVTSYLESKRWPEAESLARDCLELRRQTQADEWRRFHTMSQLGAALAGQGKFAEAEPLLIEGYEGMKQREAKISAHRKKDLAAAASRIVPFYETWNQPEKAALWRRKLASSGSATQPNP